MDHNADKRAGSTESQCEAPLASSEECMADVGEISIPVASIVAAESSSAREQTPGENQRTRVSPLSEVGGQMVDVIMRNSDSEQGVTRTNSDSGGAGQETVKKQTEDAKEAETHKWERSGSNADPQDSTLKQSEDGSVPDDLAKPQKSPSQTALVSEDTDILQIAGMQMGALKTLNTLMMSSRYLELILVPKSDLVEEKKHSDDDGDGSTVSCVFRIFSIVHKTLKKVQTNGVVFI